jgi:hypothetical protein
MAGVKRLPWVLLGSVLIAGGLAAAFLRPRSPEEFPLAELVPADALAYAGFPDLSQFEAVATRIPGAWSEDDRRRLDGSRSHLSGAIALYLDLHGEWVLLARLTRAAAAIGGETVEGDAAIVAQSPAAMERWRARKGSLLDLPTFRRLAQPCYLNLETLARADDLVDFTAAGFRIEGTDPWRVRGRLLYRADRLRTILERSVQAPRSAGTGAGQTALQLVATDPVVRIWEAYVGTLPADDRERVERESLLLQREFLGGRSLREFLTGLGPRWGVALAPTPDGMPALQAWVEVPDPRTGDTLEKMLVRAARDAERQAHARGQAPFLELAPSGPPWKLLFPGSPALRLGEDFAPAFRVTEGRLVFSTCQATLGAPPPGTGDAHAQLQVRPEAALRMARAAIPYLTDRAFRTEADSMAVARYFREYGPLSLGVLSRKIPDPAERETYLAVRRAEFVADALSELSKTDRYRDLEARLEKTISAWTVRLAKIQQISITARFTGEGLDLLGTTESEKP